MRHIKHYALGLMGAALLTAGLYSCSNEESTNFQQEESSATVRLKSNNNFEGGPIAVIDNGVARPLYDEVSVKADLIAENVFESIESIELVYGINPDTNNEEAFLTVIGVDKTTSQVVAIVADLTIDGDKLIIENPDTHQQAFAANTCNGVNCRSCQFERTGFLGLRITGCKPCSSPNDDSLPSACNHSQTSGGGGGIIMKLVETLIKYA
jgi:hypothetical protein